MISWTDDLSVMAGDIISDFLIVSDKLGFCYSGLLFYISILITVFSSFASTFCVSFFYFYCSYYGFTSF